jgi:hypothetical protein
MSTVELKTRIVKKIRTLSDPKILAELNTLISDLKSAEKKDFWDELTVNQREAVQLSRKQIKEGKVVLHEQVQQEVRGWLGK